MQLHLQLDCNTKLVLYMQNGCGRICEVAGLVETVFHPTAYSKC